MKISKVKILPIENGNSDCVAIARFETEHFKITGVKMFETEKENGQRCRYIQYPLNSAVQNNSDDSRGVCFVLPKQDAAAEVRTALWKAYDGKMAFLANGRIGY